MINNRVVIATFASWILFLPGLLLPRLYFFDIINAMGFTVGLAVLWRYAPGGWSATVKAFSGQRVGRGDLLVLGIVKTWVAMVARTSLLWWWRWAGEPEGWLDGWPLAVVAWLVIGGGLCHLAASVMPAEEIELPKISARLLKGAMASGVILGAVIAAGRWVVS